jgi:CelD/BcsL family acetyltransferase involved in cellulose biosynthesis
MTATTSDGELTAACTSGIARIATVEVLDTMADAEPIWRALEAGNSWATPFQRFDFLAAWQRQIGKADDFRPCIVIARDAAGRPLLLAPLALRREHGTHCAHFMGGKHATFNAPVIDAAFAAAMTQADCDALLSGLRAQPTRIDLMVLERQPAAWRGVRNPLLYLPAQPSINGCPLLTIAPGAAPTAYIKNSLRRFLRNKKERKMQNLAGYRHLEAESDADIARILDAFFEIKPQRMAAQGLPDIFSEDAVQRFVRDACHARLPSGGRAITLHALECDAEILAIFAGMADGQRFSTMFGTYTLSPNAHFSPGMVLTRNMIDAYVGRGYTGFDLGVGSDDYKNSFCKDDEPLFDGFIGLSQRGAVAAAALAQIARAKRAIKHSPALMALAERTRGLLRPGARLQAEPQTDD